MVCFEAVLCDLSPSGGRGLNYKLPAEEHYISGDVSCAWADDEDDLRG